MEDKVCDLDSEHKIQEKERPSVDTNAELQRQLLSERSNFDRVMLQVIEERRTLSVCNAV